jgi:hypothetical protein
MTMKTNKPFLQPRRSAETLRQLTARICRRLTAKYSQLLPTALLERALNDAEELALQTGYPLLFLPELAEEKVRTVSAFVSGRDARTPRRSYEMPTWRERPCVATNCA